MCIPVLDIVIVDYKTGQLVQECLESIEAHLPHFVALGRVVVVDNASSDAIAKHAAGLDLPLQVIRNEQNRGFAAACNQGAASSTADYLLFLNPDTQVVADSLDKPVLFMQRPENEAIGIVGIQLLNDDGKVALTCSYHPRLVHFIDKLLGLDRLSPARFSSGMMLEWDHGESRQVDGVMGAFYLVRRSLFEAMKGFDERFFVYFEEADFGLRARQYGYKSYYLSETQAFHHGQGASDKVRAQRLFYSLQSRIRYGYKHFNGFSATVLLVLTLLLEPISRVVLATFRHSGSEIRETMQGYTLLWSSLLETLRCPST